MRKRVLEHRQTERRADNEMSLFSDQFYFYFWGFIPKKDFLFCVTLIGTNQYDPILLVYQQAYMVTNTIIRPWNDKL